MTERRVSPLLVAVAGAGLVVLAAAVFARGAMTGMADEDAFTRAAFLLAALPAAAVAFSVRPAWALSAGLALAMFNSHWGPLGTGLALDRIAIGAALLSVLVREWRTRGLVTRPVDWLLVLAAGYALTSAILAGTLDDTHQRFALIDRFGLVPFALFYASGLAFREERDRRVLLGTLVAIGGYLGATAFFEIIGPRALVVPSYINDAALGIHFGRARGPFLESAADGLALYACAVAAALALTRWRAPAARTAAAVVCGLCALGVLLTLTRATWLAAGVATVVVLLATRETRRWAIPVAAGAVGIVVLAFAAVPGLHDRAVRRSNDKTPLYDRRNSNAAAVRMVASKPVLGWGWGRFEADSLDFYRQAGDYPLTVVRDVHNLYLVNAVELGLLGAALWGFALLVVLAHGIFGRGPPELRPWRIGLLAIAVSYGVTAYTSPLAYVLPTYILWIWAGVCWSDRR